MNDARGESVRWLVAAREDLAYAQHAGVSGFNAPACFFAQQAAEKAVKAVHYGQGARGVIGHSVRGLIEKLSPRDASLDALLEAARELDLFYIPTRYPNGLESGTPGNVFSQQQSERTLDLATRIVDAAAAVLDPHSGSR